MKIEKLTENKIRIFLKREDLKEKDVSLQTLMQTALESQSFFLDILGVAEEKFGFNTEGCKLLIEANDSDECDDFIFTITKFLDESTPDKASKKAVPKRINFKTPKEKCHIPERNIYTYKSIIYQFQDFNAFCDFCSSFRSSGLNPVGLAKSIALYKYEDTYCLILVDLKSSNKKLLYILSEFADGFDYTSVMESKIKEFGELIISHNAINKGVKHFA